MRTLDQWRASSSAWSSGVLALQSLSPLTQPASELFLPRRFLTLYNASSCLVGYSDSVELRAHEYSMVASPGELRVVGGITSNVVGPDCLYSCKPDHRRPGPPSELPSPAGDKYCCWEVDRHSLESRTAASARFHELHIHLATEVVIRASCQHGSLERPKRTMPRP